MLTLAFMCMAVYGYHTRRWAMCVSGSCGVGLLAFALRCRHLEETYDINTIKSPVDGTVKSIVPSINDKIIIAIVPSWSDCKQVVSPMTGTVDAVQRMDARDALAKLRGSYADRSMTAIAWSNPSLGQVCVLQRSSRAVRTIKCTAHVGQCTGHLLWTDAHGDGICSHA